MVILSKGSSLIETAEFMRNTFIADPKRFTPLSTHKYNTHILRSMKNGRAQMHKAARGAEVLAGTTQVKSLGLWWLRRDLRTADNEALTGACRQADAVLPVFCFDPRAVQPRREAPEGLGVPKLGPLRC
ncbi:hypothetical protein VOLCADRAFT_119073, partial [Volvox carteri f. nagariensis]